MSQSQLTGIIVMAVVFVILLGLAYCSNNYSLDKIKRKTVGQGQHGTARWANKNEIKNSYTKVDFDVQNWRKGKNLPAVQGRLWAAKVQEKILSHWLMRVMFTPL